MSSLARTTTARVRSAARRLGRLASQWQCSRCGVWFESDTASQTCSSCG
ncbi:hypothetical protein [Streptomyces nitrosporeus]|nr:hypothetical protein [Streptomyces nitrosporeus]